MDDGDVSRCESRHRHLVVEMLLIFRLGRPDVLPVNDFARNWFMLTYGTAKLPARKNHRSAECCGHSGQVACICGEPWICPQESLGPGQAGHSGAEKHRLAERRRAMRLVLISGLSAG